MHWYMERNIKAPRMPKLETQALLEELKELRRVASMENASFFVFDPDSDEKMEALRTLTLPWRKIYLLNPLDRLIARYEAALGALDTGGNGSAK